MQKSATPVGDFKGSVTLRLYFKLKCYVSREYLFYGPLDGGIVVMVQFAAGSFHTNKLCIVDYSIDIEFYILKIAFWADLWGT